MEEERSLYHRKNLERGTTLRWVYMQKFRSMRLPYTEGIKDGGQQKQKRNLGPSAVFTNVANNLSAATGSSLQIRNAKHNCRPLLSYPRLSSLSLGVGSSQRKRFTWC